MMLLILNLPLVGIFAKFVRVMLGAGVLGYVMRKYGYEPAPLIVGLVLGPVMERSFRQTLIISKGDLGGLWQSPLCMAMWGIALVALLLPLLIRVVKREREAFVKKEGD